MLCECGGIAQLARACGSYPQCRWFKSDYRYHRSSNRRSNSGPMVKRLRHRPFTAVTRVRFPFGSPRSLLRYGRIAQLVRALASHARGQRFESVCAHQKRKRSTINVDRFLFWWELPVPARSPLYLTAERVVLFP